MTATSPPGSAALARLESWRRPLFARLPRDRPGHKATRRRISRELGALFESLVIRLAPELVLEVGAHEAAMSVVVKRALPAARVVAFEANPQVFAHQAPRLAGAGIDYVQACVGDRAGPTRLLVPLDGERRRMRMGSTLAHRNSAAAVECEVTGVTLDGFLGDQVGRSNAIWIDVEGAAGAVIDGAATTLANCLVLLIEVETEARWAGQRLEADITAQLEGLGLTPVASDIQAGWQFNLLFLRTELMDDRAAAACDGFRSQCEARLAAPPTTDTEPQ